MDIVSSIDQARGSNTWGRTSCTFWGQPSPPPPSLRTLLCPLAPILTPAPATCKIPPSFIRLNIPSPCRLQSPSACRPAQDRRAGPAARPAPLPAPVVAVARRRGRRHLLREQSSGAGVGQKGERVWAVICAWALPAGGRKGGGVSDISSRLLTGVWPCGVWPILNGRSSDFTREAR